MAAGIGPIGPFEAIIILLVVVLIFGVGKMGDLGSALGKSIREFRKAAKDDEPAPSGNNSNAPSATIQTPAATRHCTNCGHELKADAKFCADCGTPTQAAVN